MTEPVLEFNRVDKSFPSGDGPLVVLEDASFFLMPGEVVGLVAPSGAGKSTLLNLCGLLDRPNSGSIMLQGENAGTLPEARRTDMRRCNIGVIYQSHHLLAEFTALENVMLPQMPTGVSRAVAEARARELLIDLGLEDRMSHRPAQLSGGQCQRVAIARALANSPALLLADEPTGSLDPETTETVFEMLINLCRKRGMAALVATHDHALAERMDVRVTIAEKRVSLF